METPLIITVTHSSLDTLPFWQWNKSRHETVVHVDDQQPRLTRFRWTLLVSTTLLPKDMTDLIGVLMWQLSCPYYPENVALHYADIRQSKFSLHNASIEELNRCYISVEQYRNMFISPEPLTFSINDVGFHFYDIIMLYIMPLFLASRRQCHMKILSDSDMARKPILEVLFRYLMASDMHTKMSWEEKRIWTSNGNTISLQDMERGYKPSFLVKFTFS